MATAFSENLTAEQQSQVLQLFQQFQHWRGASETTAFRCIIKSNR